MKFIIDKETIEKLIGYLQKKPFEEVWQPIHDLSTLQPYEERPPQSNLEPVIEQPVKGPAN